MKRNVIIRLLLLSFLLGCQEHEAEQTPTTEVNEGTGAALLQDLDLEQVNFGEIIYVPIYSSIFFRDAKRTIELAATLSIHNTDLDNPITLRKVNYYNLKGKLIRGYLETPVTLQPLQTVNFIVEEDDKSGGTGANFVLVWTAEQEVSNPIAEAVMITTASSQGVSFTSTGKVIRKLGGVTSH